MNSAMLLARRCKTIWLVQKWEAAHCRKRYHTIFSQYQLNNQRIRYWWLFIFFQPLYINIYIYISPIVYLLGVTSIIPEAFQCLFRALKGPGDASPCLHGSMGTRAPLGRSWNWPRARSSSALREKMWRNFCRVWVRMALNILIPLDYWISSDCMW